MSGGVVVILNEWELAELIAAYERFPENSVRKRREELTELYDEWFGKEAKNVPA